MDYKNNIIMTVKNIESEHLLKIIYRFIKGLLD